MLIAQFRENGALPAASIGYGSSTTTNRIGETIRTALIPMDFFLQWIGCSFMLDGIMTGRKAY
jgi:hypothetical protein